MEESSTEIGQGSGGSAPGSAASAPEEQPAAPAPGVRRTEPHQARFLVEIPVTRVERDPRQPRVEFSEVELNELAVSIRQHGVLQPLLVVRRPLEPGEPERFQIVAGERRWRSAQRAGLATVPCIVHDDLSDRERLEISLVENLQRKDLNAIEEATAYRRLHDEFHLTHEQSAARVGKSRPVVSNTLRLLDLPASMQQALIAGSINYGQARALLSVVDPMQRQVVFDKMQKGELSAKALERMQRGRKPRRPLKDGDPELLQYEREMAKTLGAPVRIRPIGPGGVIEVDYFSGEELSGIASRLKTEGDSTGA